MKNAVIKNSLLSVLILSFVFGFSYAYPRWLAGHLGEDSPWISYLYTYGAGLIFFLLSLIWIFTRRGIHPLRRQEEKHWLVAIVCGLLFMMFLHALWIFLASSFPVKQ